MGLAFFCLLSLLAAEETVGCCFQFSSRVLESSSSHVLRHSSVSQPCALLRDWRKSSMAGEQGTGAGGGGCPSSRLLIPCTSQSSVLFKPAQSFK